MSEMNCPAASSPSSSFHGEAALRKTPAPVLVRRRDKRNTTLLFFILLIAVTTVLRFSVLGVPALVDPTEGRYASIAQQVLFAGDWLSPKMHKDSELIPFLGKPPFHTWLVTVCYKVFGVNELSARLPSFFAALLTALLTACFCKRKFNSRVASLSVLLLFSSALFFLLSGTCLLDPLLTACITGAIVSMAFHAEAPFARLYGYGVFFFLGLGMLTKGPIGVVIPVLMYLLWRAVLMIQRIEFDTQARTLPWKRGTLVFFSCWVPVYLVFEWANHGFLYYFFYQENFLRFIVKDYGDRYGSGHEVAYGAALWMAAVSFLPWTFVLAYLATRRSLIRSLQGRKNPWLSFCFAWGLAPAIFFAFSRHASIAYLLPGVPGLAALTAALLYYSAHSRYTANVNVIFKIIFNISAGLILISALGGLFVASSWLPPLGALFCFAVLFWQNKKMKIAWKKRGMQMASVAVMFAAVVLNFHRISDALASTKSVITAVLDKGPGEPSEIAFLNRVPHSAYFYLGDRKDQKIMAITSEEMAERSYDELVLTRKTFEKLPQAQLAALGNPRDCGNWVLLSRGPLLASRSPLCDSPSFLSNFESSSTSAFALSLHEQVQVNE